MTEHSPSIMPSNEPDPLLEIIAHLGAALIQSDFTDDQIIIEHVRSAHQMAIGLRREVARAATMKEVDHATF